MQSPVLQPCGTGLFRKNGIEIKKAAAEG